ncbi:hypothetical protein, partial [Planococcus sp. CAU13]|uniref:hypothetical protein n=1 Tax=Planococcus sp. CAU13 TaxID=1541197 RepID=UPI001F29927A
LFYVQTPATRPLGSKAAPALLRCFVAKDRPKQVWAISCRRFSNKQIYLLLQPDVLICIKLNNAFECFIK